MDRQTKTCNCLLSNITPPLLQELTKLPHLRAGQARPIRRKVCSALQTAVNAALTKDIMKFVIDSPLFGDAHKQVKRPATWARFVEILPEKTQLKLLWSALSALRDSDGQHFIDAINSVCAAIQSPEAVSVADKNKTGFTIGLHTNAPGPDGLDTLRHDIMLDAKALLDGVESQPGTQSADTPAPDPFKIQSNVREALDKVLRSMTDGALDCTTLEGAINEGSAAKAELEKYKVDNATSVTKLKALEREIVQLRAQIKSAPTHASVAAVKVGSITIPKGKQFTVNANDAFGISNPLLNFHVPSFEWDGEHPDVPEVDEDFEPDPEVLGKVLIGLTQGRNTWMWGHTGAGKSSYVEYACAVLRWPMKVMNFDGELTRLDVVGREVLLNDKGTTISKFIDGLLPQALQGPYVVLADEMDFVLEDVAYVFQTVLATRTLTITEDGARLLPAHPMFRFVATANTNGQGDESGLYRGARVQSTALLNRFDNWIKVDYRAANDEAATVKKRVPNLPDNVRQTLATYITEHRLAFTSSKIMQPLSQRDMVAFARSFVHYDETIGGEKMCMRRAFEDAILSRASSGDHNVINGIGQRVFG